MLRAKAVKFAQGRGEAARPDADQPPTRSAAWPASRWWRRSSTPPTAPRSGRKLLEKVLGVHPEAPRARVPHATRCARAAGAVACRRRRPAADGRHARQGGAVRHLLRQPQRAADRARTWSPCSSTTASPCAWRSSEKCCGMPKLELGDLEAVAGAQGAQHPGAGGAGRRGLGHRRADPVLRADVQAGTAADVPGRPGRAAGEGRASSTRSST